MSDNIRVEKTPWSIEDDNHVLMVENPATGGIASKVYCADEKTVDAAVKAADEAFRNDWRHRSFIERANLLHKCSDLIEKNTDEIAKLVAEEMGKPFLQAKGDVMSCIASFRMFSAFAYNSHSGAKDEGGMLNFSFTEPYGVVAGIIPFNWPPIHTGGKVAPALAAGNCIVIKPPEQAPSGIIKIVNIINEILPPNVVNVVCGDGQVGQALLKHDLVKMVSFTGSPITGKSVMHTLSDRLVPSIMELGGKNGIIVFEDADIDKAVRWIIDGSYFNQGEACTAASRLIIHESVYDEVVERVAKGVEKLNVGDPFKPTTHVGPLVDKKQYQRVTEYIQIGLDEGAKIKAQAKLPEEPELQKGHFVQPTLFVDVTPDMRIAREEIFGPVVVAMRFSTYEEAVKIGNGTAFGLVAGVFSENFETLWRANRDLDVGIVFANNYFRRFLSGGTPFGGCKESGFGREHALETLHEYTRSKVFRIASGLEPLPEWPAVKAVLD